MTHDKCRIKYDRMKSTGKVQGPRKAWIRHPKTDKGKAVLLLDQGQAGTDYGQPGADQGHPGSKARAKSV